MQQRALSASAVSTVLTYGKEVRSRGASLFYLDRAARKQATADLGSDAARLLCGRLDIFVVEGDEGKVVTVSHRTERVRRGVAKRIRTVR
jgi:hypothetical protein